MKTTKIKTKYPKFVTSEFEDYYDSMKEEGFSNSYIKGRIELKISLRKSQPK